MSEPDNPKFIPMPYDWIPDTWCLMTYIYENNTVSLNMLWENGRPKIFHYQHEAVAYAKTL